jgi:hypothetical protein
MITEKDLREAIAECEGIRNPNASTCIKLAAYYTILDNMTPKAPEAEQPRYSYSAGEISYSDSEFSRIVRQKGLPKTFPILDELMDALMVLNPGLYRSVLLKISEL